MYGFCLVKLKNVKSIILVQPKCIFTVYIAFKVNGTDIQYGSHQMTFL